MSLDAAPRRSGLRLLLARLITFALPVALIAGGVGSVVVMGALKEAPEKNEEIATPPVVLIAEAVAEPVRLSVSSQGEVRPRIEIDVASQVGGRLVHVSNEFIEGGFFEEGDVLVEIEKTDYRLAVTGAGAVVAQAQRALDRERAEAEVAVRDWADLGDGNASALALRQPQLAEARAALAASEAQLADARLDLMRTTITAPFRGRVTAKSVDVGQIVTPGQPLGQIFATHVVEIRLPLTDAELARAGLPIAFRESEDTPAPRVTLSAIVGGQPRQWTGRVTRTASRFDASTRLLSAIVEVEDPYGAGADDGAPLAVGLYVSAEIEGRRIDGAIVLPRAALRGEDRAFVVLDDDTIDVRTVAVAQSTRDRVVILSGVEAGERVVASPLRGATDGMLVSPVTSAARSGDNADDPDDETRVASN